VFIVALLLVTLRVSMPQSETIWTAYETPGDLVRLGLGLAVCIWAVSQLFVVPNMALSRACGGAVCPDSGGRRLVTDQSGA
jgi:hypothetical protein